MDGRCFLIRFRKRSTRTSSAGLRVLTMKHSDLPLVVDFHVHMLIREVFKASTNKTVFTGFGASPAKAPRPGTEQLMQRMFDPKLEIEDMDARGIDMSVLTSN